ncbi:hypothetical protein BQ8794_100044 [Mesorhizobium prunaredense]|uniref:Uncharacterized protein n=1 Tax=Mesorhizobium prunaredense TaxID=1631249 RepID=A0A1R3V446_9HYPH|nr:hypothetical protein BQ8794_100044 [Mesorhizobium prunaredense]
MNATKRTKPVKVIKPIVVDQRAADLAEIDREIDRIEGQIKEKLAAFNADKEKHVLDQSQEKQDRLLAQVRTLRGHVDGLHKKRFAVELGDDLAEPKPAAGAAPAKQNRAWDLKPVQEPRYPDLPRTEENQKTFTETYERFTNYIIYQKFLGLKTASCHPDSVAHLEVVAIVAAMAEAGEYWNALRCVAIEKRLAEIESRATLSYKGVWDRDVAYRHGDVCTHQGSSWHCELDHAQGLQPGEGIGWKLMVKKGRDGKDARP